MKVRARVWDQAVADPSDNIESQECNRAAFVATTEQQELYLSVIDHGDRVTVQWTVNKRTGGQVSGGSLTMPGGGSSRK